MEGRWRKEGVRDESKLERTQKRWRGRHRKRETKKKEKEKEEDKGREKREVREEKERWRVCGEKKNKRGERDI